MAKFTSTVPLNIRWFGNEIRGAAGATHRIPDALQDEFAAQFASLPGLTWVEDDEVGAADTALSTKYDKTGGTISGAVTVTGALVAQSTVSAVGLATFGSVIASAVTATNPRFKGGPWFDVRAYGATGDGTTNDLPAFNAATTAVAAAGGGVIFVPTGSYYLANEWEIDVDMVHVEMSPGATLFTTAATTSGHTVGFIGGGAGLGTATTPQRTWASIHGGTIYNSNNSNLDNGVGFVRYKNAVCENVRFPTIGHKAITAQVAVDHIRFLNNNIGVCGDDGITVETQVVDVRIEGNSISSAGDVGTPGSAGAIRVILGATDVWVARNVVLASTGFGVRAQSVTRLRIEDNTLIGLGNHGISVSPGGLLGTEIRGNTIVTGKIGIAIASAAGPIAIEGNSISAGSASANTYDALWFDTCTARPMIRGNRILGSNHRYAENALTMSGNQAISIGNLLLSGGTGVYGGNVPVHAADLVDGFPMVAANPTPTALHVGQGTAAPTSGTWLRGDIVWNTTPSAAGTPGWVCVTAGTPGTWKAMAVLAA